MAVNTFSGSFFAGASLAVSTSVPTAAGSFILNGRQESFTQFTVRVDTTGTPTSYSLKLQGSLDNSHWFDIGSAITADGTYPLSVSNVFVPFIRGNITAVVGGTSPTVFMYWVASS